jgi:hypothetical protein
MATVNFVNFTVAQVQQSPVLAECPPAEWPPGTSGNFTVAEGQHRPGRDEGKADEWQP